MKITDLDINEIQRPRNCGECVRMQRFIVTVDGKRYDGGCPEFGVHVRYGDVCHPNVGVKMEVPGKKGGAE